MKHFKLKLIALLVVGFSGLALADSYDFAYKSIAELKELDAGDIASGDYVLLWDASANAGKKVDATDFPYGGGDITLDDGSGASPVLSFVDETDETADFTKADAGFLSLTTEAGDGLNVLVGNVKIGNGTPGTTQDGEDLYVEGGLEVDGTAKLDGAVNAAGAVTLTGSILMPYETVAATNVLAATECGKIMTLSHATEFVSTLPAPTAGCRFTFVVANAPETASYTIVTTSSNNILFGQVVSAEDAAGSGDFEATGADTITIVDGKAVVGDKVECLSDGTSWFCTGFASVQDGITFDTAS